jgi:hypothetical protein
MKALDPRSWKTDTPRALDGRIYPERLREYEQYDDDFMPHLRERRPIEVNDLDRAVANREATTVIDSWLDSAEWRGLVESVEGARPMAFVLGPVGRARARASAATRRAAA